MSCKFRYIKHLLFLILGFILIITAIIPQGIWSYFNDIEGFPNTLAVGYCKLEVESNDLHFDLTNLFPDETNNKNLYINIRNKGSYFIDHLYFDTTLDMDAYDGNGPNAGEKFAEQFKVEFFANGTKLNNEQWTMAKLAKESPDIAKWLPANGLEVGQQINLTVTVTFIKKNNNNNKNEFEGKSLPVTFVLDGICGNGESNNGGKANWDKSSLSFSGTFGSSCNQIYATVGNGNDSKGMAGSVNYEVYWIKNGNPKNGEIVASGEISALGSGESTKITYTPTKAGLYKFKAYQRNGHPGKGELWSESLQVSQSCFK